MTQIQLRQDFKQNTAVILHRPHPTVDALVRNLDTIGLDVVQYWPTPTAEILSANFVFFDVDMGFDEQFPWKEGCAPMPMIALIGSEAPGRIEWATRVGMDTALLKPVGNHGVYSALLTSQHNFEQRRSHLDEISNLNQKLRMRGVVLQAISLISKNKQLNEADALSTLRSIAMSERISIEEAAVKIVSVKNSISTKGGPIGSYN